MSQYITIGKIVNTQGRNGDMRVIPLTDFPERFAAMDEVLVELQGVRKAYKIERTYSHKTFIIIKFAGIDDINDGEKLKNALLVIPEEELTPLPENSFYIFDIVGMHVYTQEGRHLGEISQVLQTGANDVFIVESESRRPLLIPALKEVVRRVDQQSKRMTVCLPEGLEEI